MSPYAVEKKWTYGTANRVCGKSDADAQFSGALSEYGISTKTGYKWRERFWRQGFAGMKEESRRPKSHSEQLPEEEVCEIVRLKLAHWSWGARKIRELYLRRHGEVASESTFKRVLERAGLTQKRRRGRAAEAGRLSSGRRAWGTQ
jgi:transposase